MWWVLQIIACLIVVSALLFARWYGLNRGGIVVPWGVKILVEPLAAFAFIKSYALAPSFFQPWFLGTAVITLGGFIGSLVFFGEAITAMKIFAAMLILAGSLLLTL